MRAQPSDQAARPRPAGAGPGTATPVERAVGAAVAGRLGVAAAAGAVRLVQDGVDVAGPGEVKVHVPAVLGVPTADRHACRQVAAALAEIPGVSAATAVPPNVYLRLDDAFVEAAVLAGVHEAGPSYGSVDAGRRHRVLVSFSNPNLNKPLHLGHLRNNFLGCALVRLAAAYGHDVMCSQVVSDWGRHICQAVVGYRRWAGNATPESAGVKGDHFVGRYYVRFHAESAATAAPDGGGECDGREYGGAEYGGAECDGARHDGEPATSLEAEAAALLLAMDRGEPEAVAANDLVTGWAAAGIEATYRRIGTSFDVVFRESATREATRRMVERAVAQGVCARRPDGSVYLDLSAEGLGAITVQRHDGTLLVYSQLAGAHVARYDHCRFDTAIVVNGAQWTAGHTIVDALLCRLGYDWARRHDHLHYGMVTLAGGQMTSRTGRAVHADDLLDDVAHRLAERLAGEPAAGYGAGVGGAAYDGAVVDGAVVEALAVGLLKFAFLRVPQARALPFDDETLWGAAYREFRHAVRVLATAESHAAVPGGRAVTAPAPPPAEPASRSVRAGRRRVLLRINALPFVVCRAMEQREPAKLVQYVQRLCTDVARYGDARPDDRLWPALAVTLRRCFDLLNIRLPADLARCVPGGPDPDRVPAALVAAVGR